MYMLFRIPILQIVVPDMSGANISFYMQMIVIIYAYEDINSKILIPRLLTFLISLKQLSVKHFFTKQRVFV